MQVYKKIFNLLYLFHDNNTELFTFFQTYYSFYYFFALNYNWQTNIKLYLDKYYIVNGKNELAMLAIDNN